MAETTITGNLAGDPTLRYTASGRPVANFTVVENRRRRDAQGQWVDDDPLFMRAVAWGDLAEHLAGSAIKGDRVTVAGRLTPTSYENAEGVTIRGLEVVADEVALSLRFAGATAQRRTRPAVAADAVADPWAVPEPAL